MGQMWFGTLERARWVPAPKSDADMSPAGWDADLGLLNGGAAHLHSWNTHKEYVFEWGESTALYMAQVIKSYRDGIFGRGLLYFIDPNIYNKNVLPARWASPSITLGYEGRSHVYGVDAEAVPTSGGAVNELPVTSAYYNLGTIASGWRDERDTVFIPIPEGYTLYLGAMYEATGSGAVYATPVNSNGTLGTEVALTQVSNDATDLHPDSFMNVKGVRLWFGKSSAGSASVTIAAISGRLFPTGSAPQVSGPWTGGMGHSGCRFAGPPTYVAHSGVNDGQAATAASFVEVGDSL